MAVFTLTNPVAITNLTMLNTPIIDDVEKTMIFSLKATEVSLPGPPYFMRITNGECLLINPDLSFDTIYGDTATNAYDQVKAAYDTDGEVGVLDKLAELGFLPPGTAA